MNEPTRTSHPVWLRRGLAGLGIGFLAAVVLGMILIRHKVTQDVDDAVAMRDIILQAVPLGSSVEEAERFMKEQGFSGSREVNSTFRNLKGIDFLWCGRQDGSIVFRDWSVAIVHRDGKVTDVLVDTSLTGP